MLAEMASDVEVARQMTLHAAELMCSAAIQIHGGYGFVSDYPVEKYHRDARVFQIYDGTNEVQKILISRELIAGH